MPKQSLHAAAGSFLAKIERKSKGANAQHTHRSYRKALRDFFAVVESRAKIQITRTAAAEVETEAHVASEVQLAFGSVLFGRLHPKADMSRNGLGRLVYRIAPGQRLVSSH
jgi:hypothetical protein